eukprot:6813871-Prorocentrum_lima.AAC.1
MAMKDAARVIPISARVRNAAKKNFQKGGIDSLWEALGEPCTDSEYVLPEGDDPSSVSST